MNSKVDLYINSNPKWEKELKLLRNIFLALNLKEDIKWGIPAYIYKKKNILGLAAFKNYCGIWFHQGVFLKDEANILINAQKDKTIAMRQMRFTSFDEIDVDLVKMYVLEAIDNIEAGKEIKPNRSKKELIIPKELADKIASNQEFKEKFEAFSNSCKREYANYISEAKKEETRLRRLEKIIPMILNGGGLHDKYKN